MSNADADADADADGIFATHAPKYYEAGMSVIPLHRGQKRPVPTKWSQYADHLPSEADQKHWLAAYAEGNLGIVSGPQSGVCFADIDAEDESLVNRIAEILQHAAGGQVSPWKRIGKKGMVLAFKFTGLPNFRIKDVAGNTLVEMLSYRTQVVLPPSIHPDTRQPYEANADLAELVKEDALPALNNQVEGMLRGLLQEDVGIELSYSGWTKVTDFASEGSRDVQMTQVAGHYAHGVRRGELTLKEAIACLRGWHDSCVEHIAGDDVDINKGIGNLTRFLYRDVVEKGKQLPRGWDQGFSDEELKEMGLDFNSDQQEWSVEEVKDFLRDNFERYDAGTPEFWTTVDKALRKIASSQNMTSLDKDRILKYVADSSKKQVTIGQLRKRIVEFTKGDLEGTDHTEIAKRVIDDLEQYGLLRFHNQQWWTWGGSHWQQFYYDKDGNTRDIESTIMSHIANEYGNLAAAKKNNDHKGILQTMRNLVPQSLQTKEVRGINFANGVLTQDLELRPHEPEYGFTYTLPYRYMPDKASDMKSFDEFMQQIWGCDEDYEQKRAALQETICVTLFGLASTFQRAILLHGVPKSGKSTLLKIVEGLLPAAAKSTCPPDTWADRFQPAMMNEKLINICGELSEKNKINSQKFKSIVDGEEQNGQFKGKQVFTFRPICAHWFASNHLPKTDDTSSAFNRRWLILDFQNPVSDGQRKLNVADEIVAEEREAIAAWAAEALPRLLDQREFTLPRSHSVMVEEMAGRNNSVRFFIKESGLVKLVPMEETSNHTSEGVLHNAYWSFCCGAGAARPVSPTVFRSKMRELASELGFRPRMVHHENGAPEYVYDGIILEDARKKAM